MGCWLWYDVDWPLSVRVWCLCLSWVDGLLHHYDALYKRYDDCSLSSHLHLPSSLSLSHSLSLLSLQHLPTSPSSPSATRHLSRAEEVLLCSKIISSASPSRTRAEENFISSPSSLYPFISASSLWRVRALASRALLSLPPLLRGISALSCHRAVPWQSSSHKKDTFPRIFLSSWLHASSRPSPISGDLPSFFKCTCDELPSWTTCPRQMILQSWSYTISKEIW